MDLLSGLNEPQREAVMHTDGPLLIFAGAGSGKTRTLTHRIAHLMQQGVPPTRILAVTFTNKAAREMRERLEHLVGREAGRLWLGTFHALCAKMLRIHGDRIGIDPRFAIFDSDDASRVMKDVLKEANLDTDKYPPARILGRVSDAKNNLLSPEEFAARATGPYDRAIARLYARYQERLRAAHGLDFDDIIMEGVRLLRESEESRAQWSERFLYVLVDEYQDANEAQFKWVQYLASHHRNICVVGDDDQCLAPGTPVSTPQGTVPIESLQTGDTVCGAAGRGTVAQVPLRDVKVGHYNGPLLRITTRGGRTLRLTPNHMCFARLGVPADAYYVYLMFRQDKGFRIGLTMGARSTRAGEEPSTGLQVRVNQEGADKVWILRVCTSRAEATYYEGLYAFRYGIPTTVFHVMGRSMALKQEDINRLYEAIPTRERAALLMEEMGLDADHPHYRPSGLGATTLPHRLTVHLTCFGGNAPSLQSPWFRHRVWLNTSDRVLETQMLKSSIATRPGARATWRVERSYAEVDRTALLAEQIADAAGGADVARWAALSTGPKFAFQPASHLRPTMIVPVEENGCISEDTIASIEEERYSGPVYDLNVDHLRNYVAGGIVVHNSIYGWRGANVKLILEFELTYPDAKIVRLEQNYRSTQNILDAAHGVIARNRSRAPKRLWTQDGEGATLQLHGAANAQEEARWVVDTVRQLGREGREPGEMAILCRVNAQSRPFEEAFVRARVPLRLVGTQRFYDRREIKDLIAYLKVLYNPGDALSLLRIINVPARGIGAATLDKLAGRASEQERTLYEVITDPETATWLGRPAGPKIHNFARVLEQLQVDADKAGRVADLLSTIIDRTDYMEFLRREKTLDSLDRPANVEEFLNSADNFDDAFEEGEAARASEDEDDTTYGEITETARDRMGTFLENVALEGARDAGDDSGNAVTFMTLHSAKGLEFPIVFLVGLEQGLLPHARALWGESADDQQLEEERRLCYVGLTRARERVLLSYAVQRTMHGRTESAQPSQFLEEIPTHLLEREGYAAFNSPRLSMTSTRWDSPSGGSSLYGRAAAATTRPAPLSVPTEPEPPTKTDMAANVPKFKVGDRVQHPTWGEGLIVGAHGAGRSEVVEVAFLSREVGKKRLATSHAKLEKV